MEFLYVCCFTFSEFIVSAIVISNTLYTPCLGKKQEHSTFGRNFGIFGLNVKIL